MSNSGETVSSSEPNSRKVSLHEIGQKFYNSAKNSSFIVLLIKSNLTLLTINTHESELTWLFGSPFCTLVLRMEQFVMRDCFHAIKRQRLLSEIITTPDKWIWEEGTLEWGKGSSVWNTWHPGIFRERDVWARMFPPRHHKRHTWSGFLQRIPGFFDGFCFRQSQNCVILNINRAFSH